MTRYNSRWRWTKFMTLAGLVPFAMPLMLAAGEPQQPKTLATLVQQQADERTAEKDPAAEAKQQARRDELAFKPITAIRLDTPPPGKTNPPDVAAEFFAREMAPGIGPRFSTHSEYSWVAPGVCHAPLYYEEVNLERHGLSFGCIQPAVSSAQFFGRTLALPYLIAAAPPHECVYTLGHDRPGKRVPYYIYCPPWDLRAATVESAAIAGAILLFP